MKRSAADADAAAEPEASRHKAAAEEPRLRHRYFSLRHGESEANVAGIITSDPAAGTQQYGLTAKGREVVAVSAEEFATSVLGLPAAGQGRAVPPAEVVSLPSIRIYASDFKRTKETSEAFAAVLSKIISERAAPGAVRDGEGDDQVGGGLCPKLTESLRERRFGDLEGKPNTHYQDVWNEDLKDARSTPLNAESAVAVRDRTAAFIRSIESGDAAGGTLVVLVSHGDALQLLQTAFLGKDPREHRSLQHLNPAELRELKAQGEGFELVGTTTTA